MVPHETSTIHETEAGSEEWGHQQATEAGGGATEAGDITKKP